MLRPTWLLPFLLFLASCTSTPLPFHLDAPGTTPELFAPGIVSTDGSIELNGVISPDGREFFFTRVDPDRRFVMHRSRLLDGAWTGPEPIEAFDINQSFLVLFMVIIGGLGSIMGSFFGAAFIVLMPLVLKNFMVDGLDIAVVTAKHVEITLMGVLIIFFLIVEPAGLARLWQIVKEKLRRWPFPY